MEIIMDAKERRLNFKGKWILPYFICLFGVFFVCLVGWFMFMFWLVLGFVVVVGCVVLGRGVWFC